ncbi:asparagine synthase-related protein [Parabacteroides sp.]|uniref:asparagine synthase-related protein n=1 Tax=Parabacteroides sp. TaxID=1869337 RepID=UPI0026E01A0B|nr:asparagine synthase-related protein [Parabacteroides sp.]MDO5428781.1 asparagine synthase-related protein [Parabacteroides sp.]
MNLSETLNKRTDLQHLLFRRGWLISRKSLDDKIGGFPFYGHWNSRKEAGWHFMTHEDAHCHIHTEGKRTYFLMGHCYNPFTMRWEEEKQLAHIAEAAGNEAEFQSRIDELTGVFVLGWIEGNTISFLVDPSGMQSAYYGKINDNFVITSHTQLLGDLYGLEMTDFVKELIAYKWYPRVMGCYLPADLSPYEEMRRVVPNILYKQDLGNRRLSHRRFYPLRDLKECATPKEYDTTIRAAADILRNGAELILRKWNTPAISLTGGIDSNTTFAAANGHYKEFETFSYMSAPKELIDVEAAKKIAEHFKTKHTIYQIPSDNSEIQDFDIKAAILRHNSGYVAMRKENELRKRIWLEEHYTNDVEVKSWVSENIRAYWHKHFVRKSMPGLSPKLFRNLYKIFLENRSLAHRIDKVFDDYIRTFEYGKVPASFLPADMFRWEMTSGSWGGLNISEMMYYSDITIIYNNRKLLELLFSVPLSKRISDQHHLDMKKYLNEELVQMNILVQNAEQTEKRAQMLNCIFTMNMVLPF